MRMWVGSLALLSGLGIQRCRELWCRSAATALIRLQPGNLHMLWVWPKKERERERERKEKKEERTGQDRKGKKKEVDTVGNGLGVACLHLLHHSPRSHLLSSAQSPNTTWESTPSSLSVPKVCLCSRPVPVSLSIPWLQNVILVSR